MNASPCGYRTILSHSFSAGEAYDHIRLNDFFNQDEKSIILILFTITLTTIIMTITTITIIITTAIIISAVEEESGESLGVIITFTITIITTTTVVNTITMANHHHCHSDPAKCRQYQPFQSTPLQTCESHAFINGLFL